MNPAKYPATNTVAEIQAIVKAIDIAAPFGIWSLQTYIYKYYNVNSLSLYSGVERIAVYTDSKFIIHCFEKHWIEKWQSNGWIRASGEPVKNKDQFMELLSAMEAMAEVKFVGFALANYFMKCSFDNAFCLY